MLGYVRRTIKTFIQHVLVLKNYKSFYFSIQSNNVQKKLFTHMRLGYVQSFTHTSIIIPHVRIFGEKVSISKMRNFLNLVHENYCRRKMTQPFINVIKYHKIGIENDRVSSHIVRTEQNKLCSNIK